MPTTIEALLIISLVISPGYVFVQLARRVIAHISEPTDVRFLLTLITAGTAIHALIFPWTTRVLDYHRTEAYREHRWEIVAWAIATAFVVPAALGILVGQLSGVRRLDKILDPVGLGYIDRMPSAWDYMMHQKQPRYVRIHLKDGSGVVGGVFASRSFGSLDPRRADVFLEEAWQFDGDGNFDRALADSRGVWVAHDVMAYMDLFAGQPPPELDRQEQPDDERPSQTDAAQPRRDPGSGHGQERRATGGIG